MELKEIIEFIKEIEGWKSLEIHDGDFSIKLERKIGGTVSVPAANGTMCLLETDETGAAANPIVGGTENVKDIVSPLVGIFHELEEKRKVNVGAKLKKGDIICNIEAMKLMNEIVMPEDGEIIWIACKEGDTVEFEQMLLRYA